ncbi:hypothetical protein GH714_030091 [Hevea brasiliensis]|uniref:PGG domain-containing protein n=1 Tax=Hevea brasiliensis TaxID=3981 RepID=A0A6A6N881_HEVBR|nr:hypothetical protein GH714_030091 [Hevea brasiliensis]
MEVSGTCVFQASEKENLTAKAFSRSLFSIAQLCYLATYMADSQALSETQLASEINDRPKQKHIVTFMDAKWYNAAAEGQINKFEDYTEPLDLLRTPNKSTILHVYIASIQNETEESIEFVKLVISKCPSLLVEPNIREASTSDKMLKRTIPYENTALHEAVRNNHPQVVETLLRANPEFADIANAAGESPLYLAAVREYKEIASKILEICPSPAYIGPNGRTALHEAVISPDADLRGKLLKQKSNLAKEQDNEGWTPLHYASYANHLSIVDMLLEHDKSAAYIGDKDGKTPLHVALLNEANNLEEDEDGNTPVHLLATHGLDASSLIRHRVVDKMTVNKANLTALDMGSTVKHLKKAGYKRGRHSIGQATADKTPIIDNELMYSLQKASESHQIVAALIETVTFAAGFTLPGGYSDEDGLDEGTTVLTRKSAFKTFLVTDTIALALSISVVLIHFILAVQPTNRKFYFLFLWAFLFTVLAMTLMAVAFMAGVYAVMPHSSSGLGTTICVIGSCLALLCYWVLKAAL